MNFNVSNVVVIMGTLKLINLLPSLAWCSAQHIVTREAYGDQCALDIVPDSLAATHNSIDYGLLAAATLSRRNIRRQKKTKQKERDKLLRVDFVQYTPNVMRDPDNTHH